MGVKDCALDLFANLALFILPVCIWTRFCKKWNDMARAYKLALLDYNRHNCVVRYSKANGSVGWPAAPSRSCLSVTHPTRYDSILYFIQTARKSIDLAMMVIEIDKFMYCLKAASRRGVVVRVVVDHEYGNRGRIKDMFEAGVQLRFYICPIDQGSIMHYKFMVKDYADGCGFAYVGSMNWTEAAIKANFENTVFTTSPQAVEVMHKNFEELWDYVGVLSETNAFVRAQLHGVT